MFFSKLKSLFVAVSSVTVFLSAISNLQAKNHCEPPYHPMTLTSPAFNDGERIPKLYTLDGSNIPPEFKWANVPKKAKKLVLICDNPDAIQGDMVHWVIYDMLGKSEGSPEGLSTKRNLGDGSKQGTNSYGLIGYRGMLPLDHNVTHHYVFTLYAVDKRLHLPACASRDQVMCAMQGHILAQAKLTGTYSKE